MYAYVCKVLHSSLGGGATNIITSPHIRRARGVCVRMYLLCVYRAKEKHTWQTGGIGAKDLQGGIGAWHSLRERRHRRKWRHITVSGNVVCDQRRAGVTNVLTHDAADWRCDCYKGEKKEGRHWWLIYLIRKWDAKNLCENGKLINLTNNSGSGACFCTVLEKRRTCKL